MPKLGLTMTEGLLAEWKVAPGDAVKPGDVMFVVETDKISNEIEAQCDGVVAALHVAEGDVLPVGAVMLSLEVADRAGVGKLPVEPADTAPSAPGDRIIATPLARRMAAGAGVDLAAIAGSGPRGRIMAEDVTSAFTATDSARPPLDRPADMPLIEPASGEEALTELSPYQRVAARRLTEAKRDIPHFYVFAEADVTELLVLREQLNAAGGYAKLTVNSFLIVAVVRALAAMPAMNRVWAGEALRELAKIDVGMAVEGPRGLVAPVLRDLGALTLDEAAEAANALVERARNGRLAPQDLEGGAIAISNVGMFGATGLLPIINPGQSSIVGVGANQPVFRPDAAGQPVLRQVLNLSLSCDHRVIDGALAARFLQAVCRQLETSAALLRRPRKEIP
jgi:pyruvate dehydrogenase E2 component (dihydrolipoamide acetyltransferase)